MRQKLPGLMLLPLVLLLVAGCRHDPPDESLSVTEPDELDLIGVYEIDKVRLPAELAGLELDTRIELKPDGSFSARNIPPSRLDGHFPSLDFPRTLTSCTGVWRRRKISPPDSAHGTIWGIYLTDRPYTIANANAPRKEWLSVRCTGQTPPYGILFQLGDPEHGYEIRLKRLTSKASPEELEPKSPLKNKNLLWEENTGFRR